MIESPLRNGRKVASRVGWKFQLWFGISMEFPWKFQTTFLPHSWKTGDCHISSSAAQLLCFPRLCLISGTKVAQMLFGISMEFPWNFQLGCGNSDPRGLQLFCHCALLQLFTSTCSHLTQDVQVLCHFSDTSMENEHCDTLCPQLPPSAAVLIFHACGNRMA